MSFANRMNSTASRLLKQFDERTDGERLQLVRLGEKVFNETTVEWEFLPDVTYFLTGTQKTVSEGMVNGTTIQSGDIMITASTVVTDAGGATVDIVPTVADKLIIDGIQWSIVNTRHSAFTGASRVINFKMQARK